MWYRRTFTVPAGWPHTGRSAAVTPINLHFESVGWEAHVYLNGEHLFPTMGNWASTRSAGDAACMPRWAEGCTHQGGFTSFTLGWGATPAARAGENTLVV